MKRKPLDKLILSSLVGILVLFIIVIITNYLTGIFNNYFLREFAIFLNANLSLIVLMNLLFLIASIFLNIIFPFNLPGPLFNAFGSIFLFRLIINIFKFIDIISVQPIFEFMNIELIIFIQFLMFLIVLIIGYIKLFSELDIEDRKIKDSKNRHKTNKRITWEDVSEEFIGVFYDLGRAIRRAINKEKK
ncbi:MAG: hypothetical protein WC867_01910 [Candidatus Pacearchaeota archaeon]|jgi:hypothetical protein